MQPSFETIVSFDDKALPNITGVRAFRAELRAQPSGPKSKMMVAAQTSGMIVDATQVRQSRPGLFIAVACSDPHTTSGGIASCTFDVPAVPSAHISFMDEVDHPWFLYLFDFTVGDTVHHGLGTRLLTGLCHRLGLGDMRVLADLGPLIGGSRGAARSWFARHFAGAPQAGFVVDPELGHVVGVWAPTKARHVRPSLTVAALHLDDQSSFGTPSTRH